MGKFATEATLAGILDFVIPRIKVSEKGCWEWQKYKDKSGYGNTTICGNVYRIHRLVYFACNDFNLCDSKVFICHRCDNRICCNPAHLFIGNAEINMRDASLKDRLRWGINSPRCKFETDRVREIFELFNSGMRRLEIAKKLGMSSTNVNMILRKRSRARESKDFPDVAPAKFWKRPILCINSNIEYESAAEAARKLNLVRASIQEVAAGRRDNLFGLKFKFIESG